MANPQPDQYTKISNELLEAILRFNIPGNESRVFWAILRKTYGYKKKSDHISLSQLSKITGLHKPTISKCIKSLSIKKLVIYTSNGYIAKLSINKNYEEWKHIRSSSNGVRRLKQNVRTTTNETIRTTSNHKRKKKYTKENLQLFELFVLTLNEPSDQRFKTASKKQKELWLDEFEKCHRLDRYTHWQIADIIDYYRNDDFWKVQFKTPLKLRRLNKEKTKYIDYFWSGLVANQDVVDPETDDLNYINKLIKEWTP